jgi:hypothetical protein
MAAVERLELYPRCHCPRCNGITVHRSTYDRHLRENENIPDAPPPEPALAADDIDFDAVEIDHVPEESDAETDDSLDAFMARDSLLEPLHVDDNDGPTVLEAVCILLDVVATHKLTDQAAKGTWDAVDRLLPNHRLPAFSAAKVN